MEHILNSSERRACLEDLCTSSTLRNDETLLAAAIKLDRGFYRARVYWSQRDQVQYAIVSHRNFQLVIFPGSAHFPDWFSMRGNLNWSRKDISHIVSVDGARVHAGFWRCVNEYWDSLARRLGDYKHSKVVFAGHSRGGACAVIAALRFDDSERLEAVVTFCQPKCVNRVVADDILEGEWDERYHRYAGTLDPVPLMPPWGFSHGTALKHVTSSAVVNYQGRPRSERRRLVLRDAFRDVIKNPTSLLKRTKKFVKGPMLPWYRENRSQRREHIA